MRPQTPVKNCWTKLLLKLKLLPLRLQRLLKLLLTRLLQLLKQLSTLLKKLLLTKLKLSDRERGRKAPFAFPLRWSAQVRDISSSARARR